MDVLSYQDKLDYICFLDNEVHGVEFYKCRCYLCWKTNLVKCVHNVKTKFENKTQYQIEKVGFTISMHIR